MSEMTTRYEGRIRPSYIAASYARRRCPCMPAATRGEFAPPTLRHERGRQPHLNPGVYEGRIRPSYIAAKTVMRSFHGPPAYEGRIRPSYIAAEIGPVVCLRRRSYEGRIRPSYIAAHRPSGV